MRKIRLSETKLKVCRWLIMLTSLVAFPFAGLCTATHLIHDDFLTSFAKADFPILLLTIGVSLMSVGWTDSLRMSYGYAKRLKSLSDSLTLSCCIGYAVLGGLCVILGSIYVAMPSTAEQHQSTLFAVKICTLAQVMFLVNLLLCYAADVIQYLWDNKDPILRGVNSIRFSEYVWRVQQCTKN